MNQRHEVSPRALEFRHDTEDTIHSLSLPRDEMMVKGAVGRLFGLVINAMPLTLQYNALSCKVRTPTSPPCCHTFALRVLYVIF